MAFSTVVLLKDTGTLPFRYIAASSVIYTAVRGAGLKIKEGVFKLYPKT